MSTISASTTTTTAYTVTADTTGTLVLQTGATPTTAVTIDTSQNVGVGTSSPSQKFEVAGNVLLSNNQYFGVKDTTGAAVGFPIYTGSNDAIFGYLASGTTGISTYQFRTGNNVERMRIDSSGRVLINKTSTDGGQLNVQNGSTTTRAYVNATLRNSRPANNNYSVISWNGSFIADAWIGQVPSTDALCFGFDAGTTIAEMMRLDTNNNLLIGTTNTSYTAGVGMKFIFSADSANPVIKSVMTDSSGAYSTYNLYCTNASAYRFFVTTAGIVNATTTTITAISDQRLKENIRDLDDGLEKVLALKPRKFDWKENKGENIKNARGFIAQELELVFPDMVTNWIDEPPEGEEPYKAVNANLIPTLVKAIQEQQALIQQLQADVAALKGASA